MQKRNEGSKKSCKKFEKTNALTKKQVNIISIGGYGMEDDEDYRSIMNWLEKADLRESLINDKLYYWDIVDKTENNQVYNEDEGGKNE